MSVLETLHPRGISSNLRSRRNHRTNPVFCPIHHAFLRPGRCREKLHESRRRKRTNPLHLFPNTLEHSIIHLSGHWLVPHGFKLFGLAVAPVLRPCDRNRRDDVHQEWENENCGQGGILEIGNWMMDTILLPYIKTVTR